MLHGCWLEPAAAAVAATAAAALVWQLHLFLER